MKKGHIRGKSSILTILLSVVYFCAVAGITAYLFMPKVADASSEERLYIPSIGLIARAEDIDRVGNTLNAPDYIAGIYKPSKHKTVVIGHSSTIFSNLHNVKVGDELTLDHKKYKVKDTSIVEKNSVDMNKVVSETTKDTAILMTCYGEKIKGDDYTHRFIVTAEED